MPPRIRDSFSCNSGILSAAFVKLILLVLRDFTVVSSSFPPAASATFTLQLPRSGYNRSLIDNTMAPPTGPTPTQIRSLLTLLSQPPSGNDQFFASVRDDVIWTVTGKSFPSGRWTTKASYRNATWAKIGNLIKPPGVKLEITEGEEGIIVGQDRWATADLHTVDTYTNSGVRYDQSYAWHMRFDEEGLIAEVKVWLDTLTLEKVLGEEAARQSGTNATEEKKE